MSNQTICLTTIDNPFNPIKQFDEWFQFDFEKGYHCCEMLARFAHTAESLSDAERDDEVNRAIARIMAIDPTGMYTKFISND